MKRVSLLTSIELSDTDLIVRPGEYLTVWLQETKDDSKKFVRIQVELRVRPDGEPEVFVPSEFLARSVMSFDNWYSSMIDEQPSWKKKKDKNG